ncbi:hypothetical protein HYV80_02145 [Candidatus Woesearchaeota archaeon]|nr:hypothetical protein [Candidatus Woesearchaeota archaeon]
MVQVVFSPKWFWGKDIFIDSIALVVLLSIAIFATNFYRVKKSKNYLYLALSFYLIALSFFSKMLINFTIYYQVLHTRMIGSIEYSQVILKSSEILAVSGLFLYRLFTLLGFFMLYSIYEKQSKANIILVIYFTIISIFFSKEEYYIFYLTCLIFLGVISNRYYQNYRKNRKKTSGMLAASFSVIALSQIFFMFVKFTKHFYVVGEGIQLIGYILLLVTFITVLKHGREKDKSRHH